MKCNVLLFSLLVGILSCTGQNSTQYDYFKLALQWPNSYCLLNGHTCREQVPQYFTIDALYPEKLGASHNKTKGCANNDTQLTDETIARHKDDLLRYWPSLSTYEFEKSKKLWKDRWRKHGLCSVQTLSQEEYLKATIHLRNKHDLYIILENDGIRGNGSSYAPQRILNAVRKGTGLLVDIVCEADRIGNVYLSQIHQCVDKAAKKFIDCQNLMKNCDNDPIFPSTIGNKPDTIYACDVLLCTKESLQNSKTTHSKPLHTSYLE